MFDEPKIVSLLAQDATRKEAFEEVVRQYTPLLYRQIRRMVYEHDDANDLLQNTFLKAWTNLNYFRGEAKLSTWLYRIALNESLTFLVQKNKGRTSSIDDATLRLADRLEADAYFSGSRYQALLQEAVSTLPEQQRLVFNMRYYDEMKYREMSEILGVSEGGLKASYHHAVKKVERYLREHN